MYTHILSKYVNMFWNVNIHINIHELRFVKLVSWDACFLTFSTIRFVTRTFESEAKLRSKWMKWLVYMWHSKLGHLVYNGLCRASYYAVIASHVGMLLSVIHRPPLYRIVLPYTRRDCCFSGTQNFIPWKHPERRVQVCTYGCFQK